MLFGILRKGHSWCHLAIWYLCSKLYLYICQIKVVWWLPSWNRSVCIQHWLLCTMGNCCSGTICGGLLANSWHSCADAASDQMVINHSQELCASFTLGMCFFFAYVFHFSASSLLLSKPNVSTSFVSLESLKHDSLGLFISGIWFTIFRFRLLHCTRVGRCTCHPPTSK